jgi:polysaccharide biosynthesis protein PslG
MNLKHLLERSLSLARCFSAGFSALLILTACSTTPRPSPTPTPRPTDLGANLIKNPPFEPLTYGIQAFLWWNPTTRALNLEHVRLMDFSHVKQIFAWDMIQPLGKETFDWSKADEVVKEISYRGIKIVARVDHPPTWAVNPDAKRGELPLDLDAWGNFCGELARRYKGQIAGYQVWNEPNLAREWFNRTPDAAGYVRLLRACYTAMKQADPAAVIISAGLAPTGTRSEQVIPDDVYLSQMYDAGVSDAYDVLGLNAPGYKSAPETDPGDPALGGQRWQAFRHVEDMRAIQVARGDGAKQVAILEMGWTLDKVNPDYAWFAVTEEQQAANLAGAYQWAGQHWRPWVGLMVTIYLPDPAWTEKDEQYWWAITTPGYNPVMRPAYFALSNMAKVRGDKAIPARDPFQAAQFTPLAPPTP